MARRMLINAQRPEELRIAVVDGSTLENYQIEAAEASQSRGNVYRGVVASLQPNLAAAFIDYGPEKNGFLSLDNLVADAYHHRPAGGRRPRIEEALDKGKPVIVQVVREGEGQKGAALTTNVSLAGRYLVFTPFDDTRGISRKVEDEEQRRTLREIADGLRVPDGGGVIIRTNAAGQTKTAVNRDLQDLLRLWKRIQADAKKGRGPELLQSDQDLVLRALRDYLDASIDEVVIDDEAAWAKAQEYVRTFLPRSKTKLVRYAEREPLFSRYGLEPQIDRIYERSVALPSGGSIVIDRTEALVAIDVNSGRTRGGGSHEETVVQTNLEAASEVGRQLQLRDIGGLIVIDFIDMRNPRNRRRVEAAMKEALKNDKARTSVGRISANGLLEINRQKIRQALHLRTHRACPTCAGTGRIASPEMVSLNLLRRIEARAATSSIQKVRIALHPELADAFQNGRRHDIVELENEFGIDIEVNAATHLHRPEQEIDWFEAEPGAEAETDAAAASEEHEEGEARKRRRRRRKRGKGPEAEAGSTPEEVPVLPPADVEIYERQVAAGENEGGEAPARRRRRRRRRGGGGSQQQEAVEPAPVEEHVAEEHVAEPEPAAASPEPAEGEPRRRKRSRRRRKGRAAGGETAPPEADSAFDEAVFEHAGEDHEETSFWASPDTGEEPAPRRSGRRRAEPAEET